MMETSKETKRWALAAMIIIVAVATVVFLLTPSNATPFVMQIQNYRVLYGMGEKLDLAPVANHHVKPGMKTRDVIRFFENSGFDIEKFRKRGKVAGKRYDTKVTANFGATGILPALDTDYRFTLYFKNQKLVSMNGNVHKEEKPADVSVASTAEAPKKVLVK